MTEFIVLARWPGHIGWKALALYTGSDEEATRAAAQTFADREAERLIDARVEVRVLL